MLKAYKLPARIDTGWRRSLFAGIMVVLLASVVGVSMGLSPSTTILIIAVTTFSILFFAGTWYVILGVLFIRPILDVDVFRTFALPGDVTLAAALTLVVMTLGLCYIFLHRIRFDRQPLSLIFLLFLVVSSLSFISAILSFDISKGVYDWLRVLSMWVLYVLLVGLLRHRKQIEMLVKVLIAATFIPLAVGLYQMFFGIGILRSGLFRITGTFVWPTSYARFLVMPIILAAVFFLYAESRSRRVMCLGYLALMGGMLVATYSRGSWLSLCAALAVIGLIKERRLLVIVLILVLIVLLVPSSISDRFSDLSTSANTFVDRQTGWTAALNAYTNLPLTGLLLGAGWGYLEEVGLAAIGLVDLPVHNDYIRLLVETGGFGLLSYLLVYLALGYQALRNLGGSVDPYFRALSLSFLGILVANMLISATDASVTASPVTQGYFWACAAIMQAVYTLNQTSGGAREPVCDP